MALTIARRYTTGTMFSCPDDAEVCNMFEKVTGLLVDLPFGRVVILSNCCCINWLFHQLDERAASHFVKLLLWKVIILSTCHFVNLSFCQLVILSTCHFTNLLLSQRDIPYSELPV
jgi:hypothetical protein